MSVLRVMPEQDIVAFLAVKGAPDRALAAIQERHGVLRISGARRGLAHLVCPQRSGTTVKDDCLTLFGAALDLQRGGRPTLALALESRLETALRPAAIPPLARAFDRRGSALFGAPGTLTLPPPVPLYLRHAGIAIAPVKGTLRLGPEGIASITRALAEEGAAEPGKEGAWRA